VGIQQPYFNSMGTRRAVCVGFNSSCAPKSERSTQICGLRPSIEDSSQPNPA